MSRQSLISLIIILGVVAVFAFWYFYSKKQPAPTDLNTSEEMVVELNSFQPDPNNPKTSEETAKDLNSFKAPNGNQASSDADMLNSLNSVQP